ncbi:hypothetical protein [Ruegeria marina]|uniref:Uncharacterized protein n=1 Tax=Ruegeria marina TaxID=639004 RepID=A0A1G6LMD4_9RHOB|nr:hypothetical protein [Ruegeria marina]SDC44438.1 hypothetical protein SAMN04488239_102282 [Ruegeria marina]
MIFIFFKILPPDALFLTGRSLLDFALSIGRQMHIEDVGGGALADIASVRLAASAPGSHRLASRLCHDHPVADPAARGKPVVAYA